MAAVEVEGLAELRRALKAAGDDLDDIKAANREAGDLVADAARGLVPRRTGALLATIRAAGQLRGAVVRTGAARVPYAGPIHFGWPDRGIAPQPFLYDALDTRTVEVIEVYEARVDQLIDKHGLG
jgi:hypothetical protein